MISTVSPAWQRQRPGVWLDSDGGVRGAHTALRPRVSARVLRQAALDQRRGDVRRDGENLPRR